MTRHTPSELHAIIIDSLRTIDPGQGNIDSSASLIGDGAVVDSVGFITLLAVLEETLGGGIDLSSSFLEHGDAQENNPFRTISTLVDHLHTLEKLLT